MNKVASRLLIFFVGLPVVLVIVFLNYFNHLPLHMLIAVMAALGTHEAYRMFSEKTKLLPEWFLIVCSVFVTIAAAVYQVVPAFTGKPFPIGQEVITYAFIVAVVALLFAEVFTAKSFEQSLPRIAASVFIVLYSSYFLTFVSRMTSYSKAGKPISTQLIAVFLLMVFLCDSIAWLLGVLFGKNNKGFVKASPNKSIAGFIGGFVGSIGAGLTGYFLWPQVFSGNIVKIIFMAVCVAFAGIVGDLAESIMKRSCGFKDSGSIIPGRGGALDSLDSIIMAAPVYYLLVSILYGPF